VSSLIQIRHGFRARCHDLTLSVESDDQQWTLRIRDAADQRLLYTAGRANRGAAQVAAAEYALFRADVASQSSPERIAQSLQWQEYW
jgi:hypothetical protein